MEQYIIEYNPDVTAALVAGSQRFQASLLVDVNGKNLSVSERAAMIERIWPYISMRTSWHKTMVISLDQDARRILKLSLTISGIPS